MPYTPINVAAFTSSFAGAIAGMAVSGWVIDPTAADYNDATLIAGAFAQAFDTVWNNATQLNNLEIEAITSVVQQDFRGRGPGPFNNPRFQTPSNWTVTARACAAIILQSDIYFASQGINPGTPGGGSGPLPTTTQQVWVAPWGSDTAGNGTENNPFLTILHAQTSILDASPTKVYDIILYPGTYTEAVAIEAFVNTIGFDPSTITAAFYPARVTGAWTLGASFGGAQVGQESLVTNIDVDGLLTLDYDAITATSGVVSLSNCQCEATITLTQVNGGSTEFKNSTFFGDYNQAGGFVFMLNCTGINSAALLTLLTGTLNAFGGGWFGSINLDQNGTVADTIINSHGFSMSNGNVNIITTTARSPAINANIGDLPENCNMSGANAVLSPQMRISHQFANIAPNPTAIGGVAAGGPPYANVTTISLPVPAGLIGATDIETMQCSCSPVGANWGTFIGPHNVSVTITYRMNGGVPNVDVNISNTGAAFNITDSINLNFSAYLPAVL
jgi:hypothetical protein